MTGEADRLALLQLARKAITAHVTGAPPTSVGQPSTVSRRGAAFVTLHRAGELRGCIGHVETDDFLADVVARCAVAAASTDPRFPTVGPDELPHIRIELSILGVFERIDGPAVVEIGRHGLLVERGRRRGLLLPQVAVEWKWDAVTFLNQTCRKAGLAAGDWLKDATVWRFEAEVFSETH